MKDMAKHELRLLGDMVVDGAPCYAGDKFYYIPGSDSMYMRVKVNGNTDGRHFSIPLDLASNDEIFLEGEA